MSFLRTAILAVGLMALAGACGGGNKQAEEPAAAEPAAETPAEEMPAEGEGMEGGGEEAPAEGEAAPEGEGGE
jgi:hypothetical protein